MQTFRNLKGKNIDAWRFVFILFRLAIPVWFWRLAACTLREPR
jgi:hypothetical protein